MSNYFFLSTQTRGENIEKRIDSIAWEKTDVEGVSYKNEEHRYQNISTDERLNPSDLYGDFDDQDEEITPVKPPSVKKTPTKMDIETNLKVIVEDPDIVSPSANSYYRKDDLDFASDFDEKEEFEEALRLDEYSHKKKVIVKEFETPNEKQKYKFEEKDSPSVSNDSYQTRNNPTKYHSSQLIHDQRQYVISQQSPKTTEYYNKIAKVQQSSKPNPKSKSSQRHNPFQNIGAVIPKRKNVDAETYENSKENYENYTDQIEDEIEDVDGGESAKISKKYIQSQHLSQLNGKMAIRKPNQHTNAKRYIQ